MDAPAGIGVGIGVLEPALAVSVVVVTGGGVAACRLRIGDSGIANEKSYSGGGDPAKEEGVAGGSLTLAKDEVLTKLFTNESIRLKPGSLLTVACVGVDDDEIDTASALLLYSLYS